MASRRLAWLRLSSCISMLNVGVVSPVGTTNHQKHAKRTGLKNWESDVISSCTQGVLTPMALYGPWLGLGGRILSSKQEFGGKHLPIIKLQFVLMWQPGGRQTTQQNHSSLQMVAVSTGMNLQRDSLHDERWGYADARLDCKMHGREISQEAHVCSLVEERGWISKHGREIQSPWLLL